MTKSGIDWNKAGYISAERYEESPEIMLKVSDILLSKDGTIGKIGYVIALIYQPQLLQVFSLFEITNLILFRQHSYTIYLSRNCLKHLL